jgi:hypothetical protein
MRARTAVIVFVLGAASLQQHAPAQVADKKPDNLAAISGVVIDGTTGDAVENASVLITGAGTGGMTQTAQFTDAKGRFVFVNLASGLGYAVVASAPGYFPGAFNRDVSPTQYSGEIPLKDGEWVRDVRVTIWRPGSISGRVIDETGEAMVGVFVRALARVPVAGRDQIVAGPVAITDDRGMYRIGGLSAGRYVVEVPSVQAAPQPVSASAAAAPYSGISGHYPSAPSPGRDGRARGYPITFHPATRSVAEAISVDVALAEEHAGIDITLEPVSLFALSGSISGQTNGLTLRLIPAGFESLGEGSEAGVTRIGQSGEFAFIGVPQGAYVIDVRRRIPQYSMTLSNAPRRLPPPPSTNSWSMFMTPVSGTPGAIALTEVQYGPNTNASNAYARQAVSVGADISGLVVTLSDVVTMDGTIEVDTAPDRTSSRFSGGLSLEPAAGQPDLGVPTAQPQQGAFHFDGLRPGEYLLRLRGAPQDWVVKSIMWNGQDYTQRAFDASASSAFSGVVVTVTNRTAAITGSVAEHAAAVILFPADQALWSNFGLNPPLIKALSTSPDGSVRFSGLPAGDYALVAVDPSQRLAWTEPGFFGRVMPLASRISVGWGETRGASLSIAAVPR